MNHEPLIVERVLKAPVEKVWAALTDPAQVKQWYFNIDDFKPALGHQFSFSGGSKDKQYRHLCTITSLVPLKLLAYTWQYENYPGLSNVSFELFPTGDTTLVRITHEGLETFPINNPDFGKESFTGGWNHILGTSLKEFVEKP